MDYKDTTPEMWSVFMDRAIALLDKGYVTSKQIEPYQSKFKLCDKDFPDDEAAKIAGIVERVVASCVASNKYRQTLFETSGTNITPRLLYEFTYEAFNNWMILQLEPVINSSLNLIRSISVRRALDAFRDSSSVYFTDWDTAEMLLRIDAKEACWLIDQLEVTPQQKSNLKQYILQKKSEKIASLLISEAISTDKIQEVLWILKMQLSSVQIISEFSSKILDSYLEDDQLSLTPDEYDTLNQISIAINGGYNVLPTTSAVDLTTGYKKCVVGANEVKHLCTNINIVREFETLVKSCPLQVTAQNMDDIRLSRYKIPILEEFIRYVDWSDLQIPSTNDKKKNSDFFTGKVWSEEKIFELYKLLVEVGLLERSQEAAVSFLYRFCSQYSLDINSIQPIRWLGDKRSELVYLIYYFHEEDGRKNKKMSEFFIDRNGEHFKRTTGDKNYYNSAPPSQRIADIIKNPLFQH